MSSLENRVTNIENDVKELMQDVAILKQKMKVLKSEAIKHGWEIINLNSNNYFYYKKKNF